MNQASWFETHAHLSDPKFDEDRPATVERAFEKGIHQIIEIADGPDEWEKARKLANLYPEKVWWAAGIHPYYADQGTEENFKILKSFSTAPQFVAFGEVGLDYFKCTVPPEVQKKTFQKAISLAQEVNKPLIIHCREAFDDLLPILRENFQKKPDQSPGVVHCFSGTEEQAREVIDFGFYIGIDGPITYPNAHKLREAIKNIPIENMVLETDSPYLPPQGYRGKRNEPSYIPLVGESLATLLDKPLLTICDILMKNSFRLFRLKQAV